LPSSVTFIEFVNLYLKLNRTISFVIWRLIYSETRVVNITLTIPQLEERDSVYGQFVGQKRKTHDHIEVGPSSVRLLAQFLAHLFTLKKQGRRLFGI